MFNKQNEKDMKTSNLIIKIAKITLIAIAIVSFVTIVYTALTRPTVGDLYDLVNGNTTDRVEKFYNNKN